MADDATAADDATTAINVNQVRWTYGICMKGIPILFFLC